MYGVIYKIVNKLNGKVYIGQTTQPPKQRLYTHKAGRSILAYAIKKYGYGAFDFSVVDQGCSKSCLAAKERLWIRLYNCRTPLGYNISEGGESGGQGIKASDETRAKMAEAHRIRHRKFKHPMLGRKHSAGAKELMSRAHKGQTPGTAGKPVSEETRRKMALAHIGKIHTAAAKAKIAAAHLGMKRKSD